MEKMDDSGTLTESRAWDFGLRRGKVPSDRENIQSDGNRGKRRSKRRLIEDVKAYWVKGELKIGIREGRRCAMNVTVIEIWSGTVRVTKGNTCGH